MENIASTPILETDRLILRPMRLSDAPRIQEQFPCWDVVQYLANVIPWPYPEDGAETFLAGRLRDEGKSDAHTWAITLREKGDDLLVGVIELSPSDKDENRHFWIGKPYQKLGYMTEVVAAVNDFAFGDLQMPHLILGNAEPNVGSHRLKEKSGATVVEIIEEMEYVGGKYRHIRWKLTRQQWLANKDRFLAK
jgi:RimJ/RimL family protein N-acetyltransferase